MERGKKTGNVAIGIFIFTGIIIIMVFVFFAGKFTFILGGGYKVYIEYDFVDNLQVGAKIRVFGGPPIGYIGNITFDTGKIVCEAMIQGKYKINRGAVFNIYSTSLVGQKYINVSGYRSETNGGFYTNDEYIVGVTPLGFARTIELAGTAVKNLMGQENADTTTQLKSVFRNTTELIEGLNRLVKDNSKDIHTSIVNLTSSLKNTGEIMGKINRTMDNLQNGSKKLSDTMNSIDPGMVRDIVSNVNAVSAELKTVSSELNRMTWDKNSPLNLTRDREFKQRIENIIANFEEFSKKIKDNPSALLFGSGGAKK